MRLVSNKITLSSRRPIDSVCWLFFFFFIIFPEIGSLVRQTFLSSVPDSKSWNNKVTPTAPLELLAFETPGTLSGSWSNVVVGLWTGECLYMFWGFLDVFFFLPYSCESTYACVIPCYTVPELVGLGKTAEQSWLREIRSSESGAVDTANRITNSGKRLPLPH